MTLTEFMMENTRLRHAIQTGVAYEQQLGADAVFYRTNPYLADILKHLRTGLNCAMVEQAALFKCLRDKGLITEQEYFTTSLDLLQEEVAAMEARLTEHAGGTVIKLA